jgi:hypothetical protein
MRSTALPRSHGTVCPWYADGRWRCRRCCGDPGGALQSRGRHRRVTFLLSGGEAERLFCGSDDGSVADLRTAREHLAQRFGPLRLGVELDRYRTAARSLVTTPWARERIRADRRRLAALWKFGRRTDLRTRAMKVWI